LQVDDVIRRLISKGREIKRVFYFDYITSNVPKGKEAPDVAGKNG
jgi:hypothetical protein